ncbi:hypothetical protein [Pedobacter sp.]|uniref:hypothetical protein n=1 Tax=Pedobacter sp. TaxID=1411316 RepID=UPI0031D1FA5F
MNKKSKNTTSAAVAKTKLEEIKESFDKNIEEVDEVYEKAKDLMLRLQVPTGEHASQNELFISIQTLKNLATTAVRMHQSTLEQLVAMEEAEENGN